MRGWLARLLSGDRNDGALRRELLRSTVAMPLLARLSCAERERLVEIALGFLRRKTLEGAAGQPIDDRVRALSALQACLPILNLDLDLYTGWHAVILYPDEFRAPYDYADEAGVPATQRDQIQSSLRLESFSDLIGFIQVVENGIPEHVTEDLQSRVMIFGFGQFLFQAIYD